MALGQAEAKPATQVLERWLTRFLAQRLVGVRGAANAMWLP